MLLTLLKKFWPFLILTAVSLLFFGKLFFPPSLVITPDYGRSDAWHLSLANKFYLAENLKANSLPTWNNQIGTGYPALAEGQTGTFFLPNLLLFRFLPFVTAYNLNIIFTFILAAFGTYLFLRSINLAKPAALFGGLIFAFGGFFLVHLPHLHLIQTASLTPWLFWTAHQFTKTKQLKYPLILSLILSQQLFAGFPQLVAYSLVALTIFLTIKFFLKEISTKTIVVVISAILLGFTIAAVQLLPSWELLQQSGRNLDPKSILSQFPYKPQNLLQITSPFAFGNPQNASYPRWIPGQWGIFWENTAYVGIIPTALALAAIAGSILKKTGSGAQILTWSIILTTSILLSLGQTSPTHPIFSFPPFSLFRVPSRFLLITQLSLSVLAAIYLDKLTRVRHSGPLRLVGDEAGLSRILLLRFWSPRFARPQNDNGKTCIFIAFVIITISIVNLYLAFGAYNPTAPAKTYLADPPAATFLKSQDADRIFSWGQHLIWNEHFLKNGWQDTGFYYFARNSLDQNSNLIFNINQFSAYESLLPKRLAAYSSTITSGIKLQDKKLEVSPLSIKFLQAAGTSHLITPFEIDNPQFSPVFRTEKFNDLSFQIYQLKNPVRLFITGDAKTTKTIPQIAKIITGPNFDLQKSAVVESDNLPQLNVKNWQAEIVRESPTQIVINAALDGDGFLVLSDSFYPGWQATMDESKTTIHPTNINSRGVFVPHGEHQIIFSYEPQSLKIGATITLISLLTTLALLVKVRNEKIS